MRIYYRISDKSYPKIKLPGATKRECLKNLVKVLMPLDKDLVIIADNCGPGTLEWLRSMKYEVHETNLGNAGALLYSLSLAKEVKNSSTFYFVEDDYLHDPKRAYWLMEEGRWCGGKGPYVSSNHYWTLYDHPDKYSRAYSYHEVGKVTRTKHGHWKQSISTTMTFATTAGALQIDFPIWEAFLRDAMKGNANHPPDHEIFKALRETGRELYVSIPGAAMHTDLTPYGHLGDDQIDQFAVDLLFDKFFAEIEADPLAKVVVKDMFGGDEPSRSFTNLARLAAVWESLQAPPPPVEEWE